MTALGSITFEIQPPYSGGPELFVAGVELHAESLAQRTVSHRKKEVTSPWVAGSFVVRSVKDQVTESISVWITPDDPLPHEDGMSEQEILARRIDLVTECFDQLQYEIAITTGFVREVWTCSTADYTIVTEQSHMAATMALIKAQVPRQPSIVRTIL